MKAISHTYFPRPSPCDSCGYTVRWLQWPQRFLAAGIPFGLMTFILMIVTAPRISGSPQRPGFWLTLLVYTPMLVALTCLFIRVRYGRIVAEPNRPENNG